FISGVIIIFLGWEDTLAIELVPPVAALIPACLAIGLIFAVWPDKLYGLIYTSYCIILIAVLAVIKVGIIDLDVASFVLMGTHIPSGLIIVLVPLYTIFTKDTEWTSIFFSIGGLLISIGGVLLAFATVEGLEAVIPLTDIFAILPILLLIVGVFFVLGIGLPSKWKIEIPIISGLF
ncbi:MAG: hypothetical protein ACFFDT_23845, partial [Candidatus Hodarchaeota archaeon]